MLVSQLEGYIGLFCAGTLVSFGADWERGGALRDGVFCKSLMGRREVALGNGFHCVGLFWQEYTWFFWCVMYISDG